MMIPSIHRNGTARADLIAGVCNAKNAVGAACLALREAMPNGRDYYPQGPGALARADEEFFGRLMRLKTVFEELEALAIAIDQAEGP